MGVYAYLLNQTKREHICLGKYGEVDPIFILRKAIELLNWSFEDDIRTADEYDDDLGSLFEETMAHDYCHGTGTFKTTRVSDQTYNPPSIDSGSEDF